MRRAGFALALIVPFAAGAASPSDEIVAYRAAVEEAEAAVPTLVASWAAYWNDDARRARQWSCADPHLASAPDGTPDEQRDAAAAELVALRAQDAGEAGTAVTAAAARLRAIGERAAASSRELHELTAALAAQATLAEARDGRAAALELLRARRKRLTATALDHRRSEMIAYVDDLIAEAAAAVDGLGRDAGAAEAAAVAAGGDAAKARRLADDCAALDRRLENAVGLAARYVAALRPASEPGAPVVVDAGPGASSREVGDDSSPEIALTAGQPVPPSRVSAGPQPLVLRWPNGASVELAPGASALIGAGQAMGQMWQVAPDSGTMRIVGALEIMIGGEVRVAGDVALAVGGDDARHGIIAPGTRLEHDGTSMDAGARWLGWTYDGRWTTDAATPSDWASVLDELAGATKP